MTAPWLELEQPVEFIEDIFVDTNQAHRRPITMMHKELIKQYTQSTLKLGN